MPRRVGLCGVGFRVAIIMRDACYYRVKKKYAVWPSARASQAVAKCPKSHGHVRKTAAGRSLKQWKKERWINTKTGRPCGNEKDRTEYCRPTRRVNSRTPALANKRKDPANYRRKLAGMCAKRRSK